MNKELQILRSKINLLNGQTAVIHDSWLFTAEERARLTAPITEQVQELNERVQELQACHPQPETPIASTPLKQTSNGVY